MSESLLVIERVILESLGKGEKKVEELVQDTSLSDEIILNVIPFFLSKKIVMLKKGVYSIDQERKNEWLSKLNSKGSISHELKELFSAFVYQYFGESIEKGEDKIRLKMKKIWLTSSEEKILMAHLYNLESFIESVKRDRYLRPQKERTCEQKVIFWGYSNYSRLVESAIEAV